MRKRWIEILPPIIGIVVFGAALLILRHSLRDYHYRDIIRTLSHLPRTQVAVAAGFTALSFVCLSLYDVLAFQYVQQRLPYTKMAFASLIGYAFSNTVGYSFLSGGSIRYRLYSHWAISPLDITKIVAFCTFTAWMGFATMGGIVFVAKPIHIPVEIPLPFTTMQPIGILFLCAVLAYWTLCFIRVKPMTRGAWVFSLPTPSLAVGQCIISAVDLACAGAVLYALMPGTLTLSFPTFLGVFLMAMVTGMVSQVPGGLGVFESIMVISLAPDVPAATTFGCLLAFRAIYYLLPLATGAVMLAAYEFRLRRKLVAQLSAAFEEWASPVIPPIAGLIAMACGALLLFSGATPATQGRMDILRDIVPLHVVEASHFLGSLAGAALLLVARSLQRRVDAAYLLVIGLLATGCAFSLLKGIDYEEAIILATMLLVFLPFRRQFYRKASLRDERFSLTWAIAVASVLLCTLWLGLFSYKHADYSHELWWKFSFKSDAPRFMRGTVGAVALVLLVSIGRLLRPTPSRPRSPTQSDWPVIESIVEKSPATSAQLALLGDKSFLFDDAATAFIMYASEGRSWIAMGDPVGPRESWVELIWHFREACDRAGSWPVFYHVNASTLHHYLDLGLSALKLGEEGCVPLQNFSLDGGAFKDERSALRKIEKEGYSFSVLPHDQVPALLPTLRRISDEWLASRNTREKRFSLGAFDEDYIRRYSIAVTMRNDEIVAFTNIWGGAGKEELSVDLMRYSAQAPRGVMDYLFLNLMLWGRTEGYQSFNLGMAPFAGFEKRPLAPLWSRLGALIFLHGEHFYNFQGLRQYKTKFRPEWQPKYLVSPGGWALPGILTSVASLISGGLSGVVKK